MKLQRLGSVHCVSGWSAHWHCPSDPCDLTITTTTTPIDIFVPTHGIIKKKKSSSIVNIHTHLAKTYRISLN